MFCPKCGDQYTGNPAFCCACGERFALPSAGNAKIICPKCRSQADGNLAFCPSCGEALRQGIAQETSWGWWLLPIFFTAIGGLCAFFAVKDRDKKKATKMMILGFIMAAVCTVLSILLWILIFVVIGALSTEQGY
jgi:hypothetical protein